MREDFKELDGCYILKIMFAIRKIEKIPLADFYKKGYWISAVFGDRCYTIYPCCRSGWQRFSCKMRFCELTPQGLEFIEKYAEKKANKYKKFLSGESYIRNNNESDNI